MPSKGKKMLTLEVDLDTLASFSAAAKILGARSNSTLLNQYVVQKIREAQQLVSKEEFSEIVEKQKKEIEIRSKRKALERLQKQPSVRKVEDIEIVETALPLRRKLDDEQTKKPERKKKVG